MPNKTEFTQPFLTAKKFREAERAEFIKFNTIKAYINDTLKMRSAESAVKKSMGEFDTAIETVLKEAGELAKQDKRNTVMDQDIISAVEKHLGKKNLTWQETADEIIRQNPTDLGKISKTINDYIEKEQRNK
jgi:histone H3/H4